MLQPDNRANFSPKASFMGAAPSVGENTGLIHHAAGVLDGDHNYPQLSEMQIGN
jgi:hypothetical protein